MFYQTTQFKTTLNLEALLDEPLNMAHRMGFVLDEMEKMVVKKCWSPAIIFSLLEQLIPDINLCGIYDSQIYIVSLVIYQAIMTLANLR